MQPSRIFMAVLGCDICINKGKGCVYKDGMEELNPHILEADAIVFFKHYANYMQWENKGVLSAINCWKLADIEASDYPQQAYEMGKNF